MANRAFAVIFMFPLDIGKPAAAACQAAIALEQSFRPSRGACAQPANLPSVVDFITKHMEPLQVFVPPLSAARRCPLFEPLVRAPAEFDERLSAHLLELAQVIIQPVPFDLTSRSFT